MTTSKPTQECKNIHLSKQECATNNNMQIHISMDTTGLERLSNIETETCLNVMVVSR